MHTARGLQNSFDVERSRTLDLKLAVARWYYSGMASWGVGVGDESQTGFAGGGNLNKGPSKAGIRHSNDGPGSP